MPIKVKFSMNENNTRNNKVKEKSVVEQEIIYLFSGN